MAPRAWIVVDLGFGDSGKGTTTDALVRRTGAKWVVRYNGGAQAGHNVVTDDGRHHTFSQFGSGTFVAATRTYLAPKVIVHPSALLFEAKRLGDLGIGNAMERLRIAEACRITTPFHQAAGRIRELSRGSAAHGTCGVGVGETVRDALEHETDLLRAADLQVAAEQVLAKMERIRQRLLSSLPTTTCEDERANDEWALLRDSSVSKRWLDLIEPVRERVAIVSDTDMHAELASEEELVFEGAQGVLLDEWYGFHPHTTWSTCTSEWAEEWIRRARLRHTVVRLGILRTYATRHGQGPLPSECPEIQPRLLEPHNDHEGWQGEFRVGWPDPVLSRYAIAANGGIDALALTHLDVLENISTWKHVSAHPGVDLDVDRMPVRSLEHQAGLAKTLACSVPTLENLGEADEDSYIAWIESQLGAPVAIASRGPTARDKTFRSFAFKDC